MEKIRIFNMKADFRFIVITIGKNIYILKLQF